MLQMHRCQTGYICYNPVQKNWVFLLTKIQIYSNLLSIMQILLDIINYVKLINKTLNTYQHDSTLVSSILNVEFKNLYGQLIMIKSLKIILSN